MGSPHLDSYNNTPLARRKRRFFRILVAAILLGFLGLTRSSLTLAGSATAFSSIEHSTNGIVSLRNPRVIVVKSTGKLYLFDSETLIRSYPFVLGPEPVGQKERAGDGRTPEGRFRVCAKNSRSANHRFLGISYPDREAAGRGLQSGLISSGEAQAISDAHDQGRCPSWTTALGGALGLHGSSGTPGKQTAGCIALADRHIRELFDVLRIGDEVEILP